MSGQIVRSAARRKELGMTQQELADKLFISVKTVSKWETNRGNPEMNILPQLANALDLKITDLFEDVEVVAEEPRNPDGVKPNAFNACFAFFAAVLGIIFYALTFLLIEGSLSPWFDPFAETLTFHISGYKVLFNMTSESFLSFLFIFSVWVSFIALLAHIAFGVLEFVKLRPDQYRTKRKAEFILAIIAATAAFFALFALIIASPRIGSGLIMMFLLHGGVLGYRIYEKVKLKSDY